MDELLQDFLEETAENLERADNDLVRFEQEPGDAALLNEIFRLVHTVKGSCGFIGLPRLEALAHAAETLLGRLRDGTLAVSADAVTATLDAIEGIRAITASLAETETEPEGDDAALIARLDALASGDAAPAPEPAPAPAPVSRSGHDDTAPVATAIQSQSIRVSVDLLEELMTSVSELVLTRNQLLQAHRQSEAETLSLPLDRLSAQIGRLQDSVMRTRMQPISGAWAALPKMVRSLALDLGKALDLEMAGGDTELDRQMLEMIKDPLAHMVRNAADHGIEPPDVRRAANKPEKGNIRLAAAQEGGHITITLTDDGRGLDMDELREQAVKKGLMSRAEAEAATDTQLTRIIFAPGFSTAREVTAVSGRGVGMDVVRANVEKIGGSIEVESKQGEGTRFLVRIPLTLAIMPTLIVGIGEARCAVPQIAVAELVRTGETTDYRIEHVAGSPVLRLRGRLLPLMDLAGTLGVERGAADHVLVIRSAGLMFGVLVDEIFETEELVVKPVSRPLGGLAVYSGNAILGDGSVIMILDTNGLAAEISDVSGEESAETAPAAAAADSEALLVFTAAGFAKPLAVPLSLVSRIEDIERSAIEGGPGAHVVQMRGKLVPIRPLTGVIDQTAATRQTALVFAMGPQSLALAVEAVVDIVDARVDIEVEAAAKGSLGTAIVAGKATDILDVGWLLGTGRDAAPGALADSERGSRAA
ncbi:MAG: chemotaxis protein CheA [Pacificimonas sp.]|jgi:two-component system chemotaxis sensor kinase CheA|nr:chemotaxis protein CheA [Pacificimonas sp.]